MKKASTERTPLTLADLIEKARDTACHAVAERAAEGDIVIDGGSGRKMGCAKSRLKP
jgi:hypothetical protein